MLDASNERPLRIRTEPLSAASARASLEPEEPDPLDADLLRASCPVSDLFGVAGRKLLDRLDIPEPWRGHVDSSLMLIDQLDRQIEEIVSELKAAGADHPYVPLLMSAPGVGWVVAYTIAAEIGDITASPRRSS